jgi:CMP-N,N'-diacetyllegionaminic acid synthase
MGRISKGVRPTVINGDSVLAIVPARGGSKRLPRKNVLPLHGKPLIVWSIEAGLRSKYVDKVIVSSEDSEVLKIAQNLGVPTIDRPLALARDDVSTFDVVEHALTTIVEHFDILVLLQPTSPLRNETHIDEALSLIVNKNASAIVSVSVTEHSPLWSNTLPDDDNMESFLDESVANVRSQDLPKFFQVNGALYICRTKQLLHKKSFFLKNDIFAYRMSRRDSIDIDEYLDLKLAELIKSDVK